MSQRGEQNKLIKDLGISEMTFYRWKKKLGLSKSFCESEKLELLGKYYKIKQRNSKISDSDIGNILNIGRTTLCAWKKEFVNPVEEEHSLPENRSTYADNDTSEHPMPSSDDNLWAWNLAKKKRTERTEVEQSVKK
ncbi:hypothetical protein GPALN_004500 [Globodera pallida]|nr:hypothetical protein GPALN_004500 [Globodera pallida]